MAYTVEPIKGQCCWPGCTRWATHRIIHHPGNIDWGMHFCENHADPGCARLNAEVRGGKVGS